MTELIVAGLLAAMAALAGAVHAQRRRLADLELLFDGHLIDHDHQPERNP